jgi:5-methylcytosine-specific restriction endonuclease McrA
MQKQCYNCKIVKDVSEFSINRINKDGVQNQCKVCALLYYKEHKAEIAEQKRGYQEKHKAEMAERQRAYLQTDNGRATVRRKNHKRRAYRKNLEVTLTALEWAYILEKQNNRCNKCSRKFTKRRPPTIDHIIPPSLGGPLTSDNIQALCGSCNSSKSAKLDHEYIQAWNK